METTNSEDFNLDADDMYDQLCGEIFFTIKGNIIFHCTLCVCKHKSYPEYLKHLQEHYQDYVLENEDYKCEYEVIDDEEIESHDIPNTNENLCQSNEDIDVEKTFIHIERTNEKDDNKDDVKNEFYVNEYNLVFINESEKDAVEETSKCSQRKVKKQKSIQSNERKFKCHICGFAFTQTFNLRAHVRRHSNEKRYKCSFCPKAFHTKTEQETHMRRHKGEKPFICEECGQSFVTAGALTMHVKRHKNLRNHECIHCQKKFFDTHALKIHLVGHTGDRPFQCDLCRASFSRKKALAVHKKIHENKREYQCQYCSSSFNQKPGLYSHLKIKHGGCT